VIGRTGVGLDYPIPFLRVLLVSSLQITNYQITKLQNYQLQIFKADHPMESARAACFSLTVVT
jgi:hypothetical protein